MLLQKDTLLSRGWNIVVGYTEDDLQEARREAELYSARETATVIAKGLTEALNDLLKTRVREIIDVMENFLDDLQEAEIPVQEMFLRFISSDYSNAEGLALIPKKDFLDGNVMRSVWSRVRKAERSVNNTSLHIRVCDFQSSEHVEHLSRRYARREPPESAS